MGNAQLGKGGVAAPIKKKTRSLLSGRRRGGSFKRFVFELEPTTLAAPFKGMGPFTGWRGHPSFALIFTQIFFAHRRALS